MPQLIYSPTSPYARKCRILVRELGLSPAITETDANPFGDGDVLLRANPLGRVPCLVMDDGRALTESTLIGAWLNARAANPWLSDWDDRRLEALGHGLLDLAVARRVEMVREEGLLCDYWITRRERAILRALDELEAEAFGQGDRRHRRDYATACKGSRGMLGPGCNFVACSYLSIPLPRHTR